MLLFKFFGLHQSGPKTKKSGDKTIRKLSLLHHFNMETEFSNINFMSKSINYKCIKYIVSCKFITKHNDQIKILFSYFEKKNK